MLSCDTDESYEEQVPNSTKGSTARSDTFEVILIEKSLKWPRHLDPEGLALGTYFTKQIRK